MSLRTVWKDKRGRFVSPGKLDARRAYRKELYDGTKFVRATGLKRWRKENVNAGLQTLPRVPAATADPSQFTVIDTETKNLSGERNVIIQVGNLVRKTPDADAYGVRIMHGGVPIRFQVIEDIPRSGLDRHIQGLIFQTARQVSAARGDEIPRTAGSQPLLEIIEEFTIEIDALE